MHFNNNNQLSAQRQFDVGPTVKKTTDILPFLGIELLGKKKACPLFAWQWPGDGLDPLGSPGKGQKQGARLHEPKQLVVQNTFLP
jgi:hypothetical protein